jgi:tetratricopeptide (TPR) repeat protein
MRGAIDTAAWAKPNEVRTTLLADLARIYRDRLNDIASAELQFRKLRDLVPNHPEALDFLTQRYRERADYRALYDLRAGAIEAAWDPQQRLEWTREAAAIAADQLRSPDLVIDAWERLFRLGDAEDVAASALSEAYRSARRWDRLADFLSRRANTQSGTAQTVLLRELAEVYLSGLGQHDRAAEVLSRILATRPQDPIANLTMARVLCARQDFENLSQLATRSLDGCDAATQLDVRRVIAESLRGAGELKRAAVVYNLILEASPQEAEAWKGTEEYLVAYNKLEALVAFLARRAEVAASDEERRLPRGS